MEEINEGWGFPQLSRKAHYFFNGRSLCMKWMYFGVLEAGNDNSLDNCTSCKKLKAKKDDAKGSVRSSGGL